jgi:predicted ATP-grasp superfamily ATP-dependent carboligase
MTPKKKVELGEPTELRRATVHEIADKLKDAFVVVATERADRTEAEAVVGEIIRDLEAQKREVTMKLLGLDSRWGKWEVDHCNGRQSPITEYLASEGRDLVKAWVNDAVKEVFTADAKDKFMKECKKAILNELKNVSGSYETREYVESLVSDIRTTLVKEAAKELRSELGLLN